VAYEVHGEEIQAGNHQHTEEDVQQGNGEAFGFCGKLVGGQAGFLADWFPQAEGADGFVEVD